VWCCIAVLISHKTWLQQYEGLVQGVQGSKTERAGRRGQTKIISAQSSVSFIITLIFSLPQNKRLPKLKTGGQHMRAWSAR
jgi:hypothetical protein